MAAFDFDGLPAELKLMHVRTSVALGIRVCQRPKDAVSDDAGQKRLEHVCQRPALGEASLSSIGNCDCRVVRIKMPVLRQQNPQFIPPPTGAHVQTTAI